MTDIVPASDLPDKYQGMMDRVAEVMPKMRESSKAFYKSDSQLKMVTLDITDLTPVSAAKHILARVERKQLALKESEIALRRKKIKLRKKQERLEQASGYDAELLQLDVLELSSQINDSINYQSGAIREVAFLIEQYEAICERLGVEVITEEMYEEDQARYHVMRAFSQALAAARARQGLIDEGNFIYMQDLGINGAAAQREVIAFLEAEQDVLNHGRVPTYEMQYEWLNKVGDKFASQVRLYAEHRGFIPFVRDALATTELEAAQ